MRAEVAQCGVSRERVLDQPGRGRAQEHLAPVGDRPNPGGAVDLVADEAGGFLRCLPDVHAHADPQLLAGRPFVVGQVTLHLEHGGDARARRGERREERVALRPFLGAAVGSEGATNDRVVLAKCPGVGFRAEACE